MWGGIDFFVSLEALMTSEIPPDFPQTTSISSSGNQKSELKASSCLFPGKPTIRHFEFSQERQLTPMFVYPNATLFLQVLCSSGNRVHLMTPWSKEDTTTILKSSEWVSFLKDARRVSLVPGTTEFSFASLGIDPDAYVRTVLVVDDAPRWNSATALQLVEVQHHRQGVAAFHSMELLYALSRCILFSEWLLRYPSSAIASCAALCNTTLFAYCRFFFNGDAVDTTLMLLVSFHGGRVVKSQEEATHIVLLPPREPESSSASSSSASPSTEDSDGSDSSDGVDSSSGDDEVSMSSGEAATLTAPPVTPAEDPAAPPPSLPSSASSNPHRENTRAKSVNAPAAAEKTVTAPLASSAPVVTPRWIYRCIRALRIVPFDEDTDLGSATADVHSEEANMRGSGGVEAEEKGVSEAAQAEAYKTKLLLCCLLPPPDARPLLWTTFQSIARQHHYNISALLTASRALSSGTESVPVLTAMTVLETLTTPTLKEVVEVRLLSATASQKSAGGGAASAASTRSRGVVVTRDTLSTIKVSAASAELSRIALNRCERRRDKEAVFDHLQLVASQFLYTYQYVQRRHTQETHSEAGTQTSGPRHASIGVMTDGATADVVDEKKINEVSTMVSSPLASGAATTTETMESVDAEEWRHHLKNVEGKLLSRHEHPHTVGTADRKDEAQMGAVKDGVEEAMQGNGARKGDDVNVEQTPASPLSQQQQLVARAQGANSIFQSAPLFPSPLDTGSPSLYFARPFSAVPLSSEALYTSCFIPTAYLTQEQQDDFFVELRSYPIFSSPELGNNVVRLPDGAKCEFPSHKAAEDFHRIEYIEFLSLHLPIYPYFEEAGDRPDDALMPPPPPQPQRSQQPLDFALKPVPSAVNTAQQAQSLWTTPKAVTPESARRAWTTSSVADVADSCEKKSALSRHYKNTSMTTKVPPYRSLQASSDGALAAPPPHKHLREEFPTGRRQSPEKERRRIDDESNEDARPPSSSVGVKSEEESRPRRHHRDDSPRRRDDRRERCRNSSGSVDSRSHRRGDRRDERARYSVEGSSGSRRDNRRSHREPRRRRSLSDSGED